MLANEQMRSNRYGQWAQARQLYRRIQDTLTAGGIVTVATATHAIHYYPKHANLFKATQSSVYVQHGKRWDCIDYCSIVFRTPKGF
jgi:hypothetical protein